MLYSRKKSLAYYFFWLALFIIAVFFISLKGGFIYDDNYVITNNDFVKFLSLNNLLGFFKGRDSSFLPHSNMYRPLLFLGYAFDYWLGKGNAFIFHLDSLLWHIGTVFLFFLVLIKTLGFEKEYALWFSLLFSLQPVNSQSVCLISARADIMFSFFLLASFYFYVQDKKSISFLFFILSLLSKETAVIFLPLIVGFDYFYQRKKNFWFYGILTLAIIAYLFLRRHLFSSFITSFHARSYREDLILFLRSFFASFGLWFLPYKLAIRHTFSRISFYEISGFFIFCLLLCSGLRSKKKEVFLGLWWAVLPLLLLVFGSFNVPLSEQRLYFSGFGFAIILGILLEKTKARQYIFKFLFLVYFLLSFWRAFLWSNSLFIWADAAKKYPKDWVAFENLGLELEKVGNFKEAEANYKESLRLNPLAFKSAYNLGTLLGRVGKIKQSIFYLKKAIFVKPNYAPAFYNLALSYLLANPPDKENALKYLKKAESLGYKVPPKIKALVK